jgi:hypothetical protein
MSDPALIRDQAILEAATRALDNCIEGYQATAIVAAVTPLIRAQVLEEAALVAEKDVYPSNWAVAARIRALKEQP